MNLVEALACLKEDGSNYITWSDGSIDRKLKIEFGATKNRIVYYSKWSNEPNFGIQLNTVLPLDNWQLHEEPKFKVGDLVKIVNYKSFDLWEHCEQIGRYGVIDSVDKNGRLSIKASDKTFWRHNVLPENVKLILPAAELAEKLGGNR